MKAEKKDPKESTEVVVYDRFSTPAPMELQDIRGNVDLIRRALNEVMRKGIHYGKIPGCGDKPALLKPGAEVIMFLFKIAAFPDVTMEPTATGTNIYVKTRFVHVPTHAELGQGIGAASTDEDRYKWRSALNDAEYERFPAGQRRLKAKKKYRRGQRGYYIEEVKQVRTNPADVLNTAVKMAKKRSIIDGVLSCTAASELLTQDLIDGKGNVMEIDDTHVVPEGPTPPARTRKHAGSSSPSKATQTTKTANGDKWIKMYAKNAGNCKVCGNHIEKGNKMIYNPKRGIFHHECAVHEGAPV